MKRAALVGIVSVFVAACGGGMRGGKAKSSASAAKGGLAEATRAFYATQANGVDVAAGDKACKSLAAGLGSDASSFERNHCVWVRWFKYVEKMEAAPCEQQRKVPIPSSNGDRPGPDQWQIGHMLSKERALRLHKAMTRCSSFDSVLYGGRMGRVLYNYTDKAHPLNTYAWLLGKLGKVPQEEALRRLTSRPKKPFVENFGGWFIFEGVFMAAPKAERAQWCKRLGAAYSKGSHHGVHLHCRWAKLAQKMGCGGSEAHAVILGACVNGLLNDYRIDPLKYERAFVPWCKYLGKHPHAAVGVAQLRNVRHPSWLETFQKKCPKVVADKLGSLRKRR